MRMGTLSPCPGRLRRRQRRVSPSDDGCYEKRKRLGSAGYEWFNQMPWGLPRGLCWVRSNREGDGHGPRGLPVCGARGATRWPALSPLGRIGVNLPETMNRSNKFTALLIAAGLSVLALPLPAQISSSPAAPGERTLPAGPGVSPDSRTGSASTDSSPSAQPGPQRNTTVYGPRGAIFDPPVTSPTRAGFEQLDADRDGRVSLTEYIQSSLVDSGRSAAQGSDVTPGPSSESSGRRAGSGGVSDDSATAPIGSRSGAGTGISGGKESAERRAERFRELDRDHDGYLTRAELDVSLPNTPRGIE